VAFDDALGMSMLGFKIFQRHFKLIGLCSQALGGLAELHAPQAGQLNLELLDLQRRQLNRVLRHLQLLAGLVMGGSLGCQRLFRSHRARQHSGGKCAQFCWINRQFEIVGRHASR
jgi:hypothetical protein